MMEGNSKETYSPGYNTELVSSFQLRSAQKEASFFMPFIKKGSVVLDCGCGPGSITIGIAVHQNVDRVVGVDFEEKQLSLASERVKEMNINNVTFCKGNIYSLDFPNDSFDAVFVNGVFQHLKEPMCALSEILRVLKQGGVVGLRDDDHGSMILAPSNPEIDKLLELLNRHMIQSGGDPYAGRHHKSRLIAAGFTDVQVSVSCEYDKTMEETRRRADVAISLIKNMKEKVIALGWVNRQEVKAMTTAIDIWGSDPGAFNATMWCEAIGFKG
jgi:ubiquinone/menaquinone biosynthesis C-methylase UbiE